MSAGTARILNVDDDEGCRDRVTRTLQHHHFQVQEASTGAEALRLAATSQPDLVLLDVDLPDMSGFEVCRRLKSEPATARIPVLHVNASNASSEEMARGLEHGADSYLVDTVEPEVLIATIHSVLRARQAAESARLLAREWQATFDAISDGVAVVDAEDRIKRCNRNLAKLLRLPFQDILGRHSAEIWGDLPAAKQPFLRAAKSRQRETLEIEIDDRRFSLTADPILDENGNVTGAVHIVSDVTERRRLEDQFRESQKFETIGTLAAGVAHDFNNLLTSMMGNASLLMGAFKEGSFQREQLDDIVNSGERAADLTRQLLAYSGKGRHFMQELDLSRVVKQTKHLIEATVGKKIEIEWKLSRHIPHIEADQNQLQQMILNLASNAAEAIGLEAGTISIVTGIDHGRVFLEVCDNGCGMDADTRARIFDPFFTTKFTGRGLGLAAVSGIARGHHAAIHVKSEPGHGSTFRVVFPRSAEPQTEWSGGGEDFQDEGTILVVDDEDMVRRIARAALELRGYKVLLANDGLDAIHQARKNPAISVVLLDMTMPVMGGADAIDEIMRALPDAKVVVSTGYDHAEATAHFGEKRVSAYLQKPYTSRQLAERIRAVLRARSAGQ